MRYVIIGSGNISNTYINAINALESSTVVGCISRSGRAPSANSALPVWSELNRVEPAFDAVIEIGRASCRERV